MCLLLETNYHNICLSMTSCVSFFFFFKGKKTIQNSSYYKNSLFVFYSENWKDLAFDSKTQDS